MRTQHIIRRRGDTASIMMSVVDHQNNALDISGASFKLTVNSEAYPSDATNQVFQSVGSVVDAAAGTVTFPISPTDADNPGEFYYDIEMTDVVSKIETIASGRYIVLQDITKT